MQGHSELIATRESLLSRLKDWEDAKSWREFFDAYWKLIYKTARKAGLDATEAQDAVQETLVTVCKNIRTFKYDRKRGAFKSWLLITATWRIRDQVRKRKRLQLVPFEHLEGEGGVTEIADPSEDTIARIWDEDWERTLTEAAIEKVKNAIAPKEYQIFDLAVLRDWPTRKIASTLNVNIGYVYLVKHRTAARIRREFRKLQEDPL